MADNVQCPRSACVGLHKITFPYKIDELVHAFLSAVVAFLSQIKQGFHVQRNKSRHPLFLLECWLNFLEIRLENILHVVSRWHGQRVVRQILNWTLQKCSTSAIEVCEYCYLTVEAVHKPVKNRKKWNRLCRGIDCAVYWEPRTPFMIHVGMPFSMPMTTVTKHTNISFQDT